MVKGPASKFETLRPWNGSQDRAFEEISYQLLKEDAPTGARPIRTGNPDGGVEWYATLPNGDEWGWQAKNVRGIDALLSAMSESVRRVVVERPNLKKLTFVVSWNLGTGTSGNTKTSQRQKYNNKIASWKNSVTGATKIDFQLVQESDLLDRLSKPEHRGREWFWWGDPFFGPAWLHERYLSQSEAAGERYRPELQVDLPIEEDLVAMGFGANAIVELRGRIADIKSRVEDMSLRPIGRSKIATAYRRIVKTAQDLKCACEEIELQADTVGSTVQKAEKVVQTCIDAISKASEIECDLARTWEKQHGEESSEKSGKPPVETRTYSVRNLATSLREFSEWMDSTSGKAFRGRLYFLDGPAGAGKTHLLLDGVRRALSEDRPAIVLFGDGSVELTYGAASVTS